MPITIKSNTLKYKDPSTGNYVGIDTLAETATSTQVAAVNAAGTAQIGAVNTAGTNKVGAVNDAGTAQIAAVNAAGAAVIQSIPSDYSTLSGDVDDLKTEIDDEASGLKQKASVIFNTASGSIATFSDGGNALPVVHLKIGVKAVQSGWGDPSPSNIRTFTGWTGYTANIIGGNVLDITQNNNQNKYIHFDGRNRIIQCEQVGASNGTWFAFNQIFPKGTYNFYAKVEGPGASGLRIVSTAQFTGGTWNNSYQGYWSNLTDNKLEITVNESTQIKFVFLSRSGHTNEEATAYDVTFAPTACTEYSASWNSTAGTIYGGNIDAVTGEITKTHGIIASYNGETLPGEWASDRDVYAEGTTPTTGAQVVYELAEPVTYNISGVAVYTLGGENNVWATTGDIISCEYRCDTKEYIRENTDAILERITHITPKMFGAVGDGETDDSDAIQATLDYGSTNKVVIDVSDGLYLFGNVKLYDSRSYHVVGGYYIDHITGGGKPKPCMIVKGGSVGFIGERSAQEYTVASLPTVRLIMDGVKIKGVNSSGYPTCFKDIHFVDSRFTNVKAAFFSCFAECMITGHSVCFNSQFASITDCVFRSWTELHEVSGSHSFVDFQILSNRFSGLTKANNTLFYPTVFECNSFYNNFFKDNFVGSMWAVIGSTGVVDSFLSSSNIYSYVPYFAWDKTDDDGGELTLAESVIRDDMIWYGSANSLKNTAEGKEYFDDYSSNSRIAESSVHFYRFDEIVRTTIKDIYLRSTYDGLLNASTKFFCAEITGAHPYSNTANAATDYAATEVVFDTYIPISDYNSYASTGYKYTKMPWSGRTVDSLPTIQDSSYRYVLEGQTCYYNHKLLTCWGNSWYDTDGNEIT